MKHNNFKTLNEYWHFVAAVTKYDDWISSRERVCRRHTDTDVQNLLTQMTMTRNIPFAHALWMHVYALKSAAIETENAEWIIHSEIEH